MKRIALWGLGLVWGLTCAVAGAGEAPAAEKPAPASGKHQANVPPPGWRAVVGALRGLAPAGGAVPAAGETPAAHDAETPGWQALLDNDWDAAAAKLAAEAEAAAAANDPEARLRALQGQAFLAWFMGRDAEAAAHAAAMARLTAADPRGAYFFSVWLDCDSPAGESEQVKFAQELYAAASPANRVVIAEYLAQQFYEAGDYAKAKEYAAALGAVDVYARVSGPYAMQGALDTDQPQPPQVAPAAPTFVDDFGEPVQVVANVPVIGAGGMEPGEWLPRTMRGGEAVAQAAVDVPAAGEARLVIGGDLEDCQAWLNGLPVFKSHYFYGRDVPGQVALKVRLKAGVNALIVRCHGNAALRLQILGLDGAPLPGVKALPFRPDDWKDAAYRDLRGVMASEVMAPTGFAAPRCFAERWWQLRWLIDDMWVSPPAPDSVAAVDALDAMVAAWPGSALVLSLAAASKETLETPEYGDSEQRLRQQAEDLAGRAIAAFPGCLPAALVRAGVWGDNDLTEQAIRELAPLVDKYPDCPRLRSALADLYLKRGFDVQAAAQIDAYAKLAPARWRALARFREKQGRAEEAAALFAAALQKGDVFNEWETIGHFRKRGDHAAAREWLEKWHAAYPGATLQYLRQLREWEKVAGKEEPGTLEKLMAANPADAAPLNEAAEIALRAGDADSALAFWRRSRALAMRLHKTDPGVLRHIEDLAGQEDGLMAYDIKLSDVNPAKVVKTSKASHAVVLRVKATRLYPDLSNVTFNHVAVKPFDRTGVDELGEQRLPRRDDMLYCRTVHPDGSVFVPDSADNDPRKAMSMYNVKPDSVLEWAGRQIGGSDDLFRESCNFQEFSVDVARARYVLVLPRALLARASFRLTPEDFAPTVKELDGGDVALIWDAEKQEGVMPEKLLPQGEPAIRRVEVRIFGKDDRRATWFDPVPLVRSSPAIDAKAQEICRDSATPRAKLEAIYRWLATEVEDDEDSSSARDAFATRSGTLESRAMLCIAMLRAVGLRAYFARANSDFSVQRGQLPRERMSDLRGGFNDELLAVELPGEGVKEWLAFRENQKFYRLGDIGQKMSGVLALTNSPWGLRLENVRPDEAELLLVAPPVYRVSPDGSAKVSGAMTLTGAMAGRIRGLFETPFRARQVLQRQLASMHPHVTDLQLAYPEGEALTAGLGKKHEDVRIGYQGVIRKYALPSGEGLMVRPTPQSDVEELAGALPLPRVHDIELGRDLVSSHTVEYEAPAGWAFAEVPPDRSLPAEFGLYLQDYQVNGRRLTLSRSLIVPAQRIKAAHAPAFARFLAKVAEFDEAGFRLVPLPEGSPCTAIDDWGECGRYDVRDLRAFDLPENLRRLVPATGKPAPGQGDAPTDKAPAAAKPAA